MSNFYNHFTLFMLYPSHKSNFVLLLLSKNLLLVKFIPLFFLTELLKKKIFMLKYEVNLLKNGLRAKN